MNKIKWVLYLIVISVVVVFMIVGCGTVPDTKQPTYDTGLATDENRNSTFNDEFPLQYQSYLNTLDDTQMTVYAGSVPHDKHDNINPLPVGYQYAQPYLKNLWLGYPFSYEYKRARGHAYALEDILQIDRINNYGESAILPSSCWNCKTTKMPVYLEEHGDDFWAMEFNYFREEQDLSDNTIGCSNCHQPTTMELRITSQPLNEALQRQGIDWQEASKNDMRSYVCGQCHVEYYFQKDVGIVEKVTFPWDYGFGPGDMYEYYSDGSVEKGFEGAFADWTHAVSGTPMLKTQHPEFEHWIDGTHGAAGVSCADCHMPYVREDGKKKISSHHVTSPLNTIDQSCLQCHGDKTAQYLKERVIYTQERTWEQLMLAQDISVRAHEAVRLASEYTGERHPDYEKLLIEAREMVRKGQWYWDYISAENSVGFHNPQKALDTLASSQEYSRTAVDLALRATRYRIAPQLEGNIKEIVPPIMEHSRLLQQNEAHLKSHIWLQYLPLLPQTGKIWDLNRRIE